MDGTSLAEFVEQVSGTSHLRVEYDFGGGFVRLRTSEAERRQAAQDIRCSEDILIELLRNARDAHASHIFVALSREGNTRFITVIDDGEGIRPDMHEHIFEPRVTSKLDTAHRDKWGMHGRGMALYSVSENSEAAYVAASDVGRGSSIVVRSDTTKLPEKADQSSFPTFLVGEDGKVNVRGPKNLLRNACEFAIEERATCTVFVGSPAETVATLYDYGTANLSVIDRAFCHDVEELPIVKRLATTGDPESLASLAKSIGLPISSRTARRILDGQITAPPALLDRIVIQRQDAPATRGKRSSKAPSAHMPKMQADERQAVAEGALEAFAPIAERYYLDAHVIPSTRLANGTLTVSIPLVPLEDDIDAI